LSIPGLLLSFAVMAAISLPLSQALHPQDLPAQP